MSATATRRGPAKLHVLGHYELPGEARILVGRRIDGEVYVYDYPAHGRGPRYFVERGFDSKAELAAFIADYRREARCLRACPMSRSRAVESLDSARR